MGLAQFLELMCIAVNQSRMVVVYQYVILGPSDVCWTIVLKY